MEVRNTPIETPFFSICIPQYNRTALLIEACKTLAEQTFNNFEVCISDDSSTDGKEEDLLTFLQQSGLSFIYRRQQQNIRYDGNLRASINLARGKYCFLLGNDDALASATTLQEIYIDMKNAGGIGAAITNFEDYRTGKEVRRVRKSGLLGAGPIVAANNYRNVSFVSGVILNGDRARALATSKWDDSEMYQMYLMSRLIAEGGQLLGIDRVAIRKDIRLVGEEVDGYTTKPRVKPCPIVERKHTFHLIGRLVVDAIAPYLDSSLRQTVSEKVLQQLILFTYPYWLVEYRRVQSWNYAAGICLGMKPRNFIGEIQLNLLRRLKLTLLYILVSILGLVIPVKLFDKLYSHLHTLAKSNWGQLIAGARIM
jgi:glycosyltransferase involved in cell wall biosynthesis